MAVSLRTRWETVSAFCCNASRKCPELPTCCACSQAALSTVIEKGKKAMPGYESKPTKDEISGVVEYIRSLKIAALSANFEDSDAFPR